MTKTELLEASDAATPLHNVKHEKFALLYATDNEFFGSGVDAYVEAYDVDTSKGNYRSWVSVNVCKLLKDAIILARINYFLETRLGLNDAFVDQQLAFVVSQSADLRSKMAGIREYNTLKGRIKKKIELSFVDTPDTELDDELEEIEKELAQALAMQASRRKSDPEPIAGMPQLTDEQKARASQEV